MYLLSLHRNSKVYSIFSSSELKLNDESLEYFALNNNNNPENPIINENKLSHIISKIKSKILKDILHNYLESSFPAFNKYSHLNHELFILAMAYNRSLNVDKDKSQSIELLKLSSEKSNGAALCHLGICYFKGYGVDQNIEESSGHFQNQGSK